MLSMRQDQMQEGATQPRSHTATATATLHAHNIDRTAALRDVRVAPSD